MGVFIQGINGIIGEQGSGKGFAMLKIGLLYANQIQYDLCFNFEIDEKALYNYCLEMGYTWLLSRILHNKIRVKNSKDLISFMDLPKTIYILDEAGVYLNSRRFRDIDPDFLHEIAQVRHDCKLLWWVAQYPEMVDKMLRSLTASFIQVDGKQRFNKKLGNSELIWQRIYLFNARNFNIYLSKVHDKFTGIKYWLNARRLADFHWEGVLDYSDKMIFDIYQSFGYRVGDSVVKQIKKHKHNSKLIYVNYPSKILEESNDQENSIIPIKLDVSHLF